MQTIGKLIFEIMPQIFWPIEIFNKIQTFGHLGGNHFPYSYQNRIVIQKKIMIEWQEKNINPSIGSNVFSYFRPILGPDR